MRWRFRRQEKFIALTDVDVVFFVSNKLFKKYSFFERKNNQKINDILSIITGQFPLTNFDAKDKFSDSNNVKWSLDLNVDVDIMFK